MQYFSEVFKEAGVSPKRVVLMYCNDLFGQNNAKGFQAAHAAAKPSWEIVDVIPWPEPPQDLSTEVSRAKAAKPDIIAPITRPASAQLLLPEIRKQRIDIMGIVGPGQPRPLRGGPARRAQGRPRLRDGEHCRGRTSRTRGPQAVAEEYQKRSGGKTFDTNSGYSYDGMMLIADVLERAKSTDPDAIVDALKDDELRGRASCSTAGPSSSTRSATTPTRSPP